MNERLIYFTNPANLVSLWVFLFTLGVTYAKMDAKIKDIEKRLDKIDELDLDSRLTRIEANLDWIRSALEEIKKKK